MNGGIGGIGGVGGGGRPRLDTGGFRLEGFGPAQDGVGFADTLKRAVGDIEALQEEAKDGISAFLRGEPVELHQVMASAEEAGIALELLIEVRNKLAEAYRTVINMQT